MGLIIQTTVLIMVIGIITYSRLDLFLPKRALEQEIVQYMSRSERSWMNTVAAEYYINLRPGKRANGGPREQGLGTGFISLRPLFGENQEQATNTKAVLKNLLLVLYARQPFVENEIRQGRYPDAETLFADLIDAIILAGKNQALASGNEQGIFTEDQFLRLGVGSLQPIFMNVVNGCSCVEEVSKNDSQETQEEGETEPIEGIIPRNFCSLLSFANMETYKPLSIYLAPKEILMALYGSSGIVDDIIKTRTSAYKEYKKTKSPEAKAALERFKTIPAVIDSKYLEFNVTTTNPNRKR